MSGLFNRPKVEVQPQPDVPDDDQTMEAMERERLQQQRARGFRSTLLTGGTGVQQRPMLARKTLLGQ